LFTCCLIALQSDSGYNNSCEIWAFSHAVARETENTMKKIFALIFALVMALSAVACSSAPAAEGSAEAEVIVFDPEAPIVTIGDEVITFGEYEELFNTYAEYYAMMGYDMENDAETVESLQDFIVDTLVEEKVIAYQAKENGYDQLSDEKIAEIEVTAAAELEDMAAMLREQAEADAKEDSTINVEERLAELFADEAEYYTGTRMTQEEMGQWIKDYYMESAVTQTFREAMLADVTVSDEEIKAWYDSALAEDAEVYAENPEYYKGDKESEELYGDYPVLFAPEGYKRMLHILIMPEDAMADEYYDKETTIETLRAEYGELAFAVEVEGGEGADRMKEIVSEYKQLKADMEKLEKEYYASAVTKANEAYAKLKAGESFETVMAEYNQDTEQTEKGRLISNQYVSDYDWSNEVKAEFATLKIGEYSKVVQDDEGCHILYYLGDEPAGNAELDTVKDAIRQQLLFEAQDEEWIALVEAWKNDGSVKLDHDLIHSLEYHPVAVG